MDVTDLQFKLQHKLNIFSNQNPPLDNCNLLASASTRGVVFVGGYETHLLVCPLSSLVDKDVTEEKLTHFKLQLPSRPHQIALSCDDAYLAVDVEINRNFFVLIYSVDSIINQQPKVLEQVKLAADDNVRSKQILWNPVHNNVFAVVLDNGSMSSNMLQEKGFQFSLLDKAEQIQCACWSPKGKQIVVGFRNGKIVQYKPDLKPARTIQCPPGTFGNSFQTIAIQWLSTYQFATMFLSDESPDATPCLHIVNAPKAGSPAITGYGDICYSSPGPRKAQVFLIHLAQWNILMVASANSTEVSILGTNETGDFPVWNQWIPSDESRAELPLTANRDDTYPIGFCLETGCTHSVFKGEIRLPVMPMIHLLSTHGIYISFNVVNLKPNYVDICSPPRPLPDGLRWEVGVRKMSPSENLNTSELSFASPINKPVFQTSTPANEKLFFPPSEPPKPIASNLFGTNVAPKSNVLVEQNKATMPPISQSPMFSMPTVVQPQFGTFNLLGGTQPGSNKPTMLPNAPQQKIIQPTPTNVAQQNHSATPAKPVQKVVKAADPIITVQPTFKKSVPQAESKTIQPSSAIATSVTSTLDDGTIDALIFEEVQNFGRDLKDLLNRTKNGKELESNEKFFTTEYKTMVSTLSKLKDIMSQATEATETLKSDIHSLRLSLNEAFAMQTEAQSKYNIYNEPDYILLYENAGKNQTNQKQLAKLRAMLKANEVQFNDIYKTVYSQFSNFEDAKKRQSRDRLKIPNLQLVYQSINKQQDLIQHQRKSLNLIKNRIGLHSSLITDLGPKTTDELATVASLTDSIISLSIADRVKAETSRFTDTKKKNLLEFMKDREIRIIKQSRPENELLISNIINSRKIVKETTAKREKEAKSKEMVKIEPKPQVVVTPKPMIGKMPLAPSGQHVYKPSPVTASQDTVPQLPKFMGFSTPATQVLEPSSNAQVERKKKDAQKVPTATLPTGPTLVFPGLGSGFGPKMPVTTIKKSEPDSIPQQPSMFPEHNQKPSPNFGFGSGSTTTMFSSLNFSKEVPKLQEIKTKPNIQTIPSSQIVPKPVEVSKSSTAKLSLQDVSNADKKTISSMPSGVDFSLGAGLSITKLEEKPASMPQAPLSLSLKMSSAQEKPVVEDQSAPENTPLEIKPVVSTAKAAPLTVSQPEISKVPPPVPATTVSIFQSIGAISAPAPISTQSDPISTSKTSLTASTALPSTITTETSVAATTTITTTSSTITFGSGSSFSFANAFAAKTESSTTSEPNPENLFQGINICKPTATTTTAATSPGNIFSSALTSFGNLTGTSSSSMFGGQTTLTNSSATSIFGGAPPNTVVSTAAPFTPVSTTTPTVTSLPFGASNASNAKTESNVFSAFGTPIATTTETTSSNLFQNTSAFGTGNSIFGGTSPTSTSQVSQTPPTNLFGSALSFGSTSNSTSTTLASPFAAKPAEPSTTSSPFGGSANTSIFGGNAGATASSTSVFGFAPVAPNSSSVFGGNTSGDSIFSASTSAPSTSVFGSPINSSATSGGSLFQGGFGQPAQTSNSIFGGGNTGGTDSHSSTFSLAQKPDQIFGSPSTFGQTTSTFGSPSGGAFSAAPQPVSSFGAPSFGSGGGSPFGNTSPIFGGPATFGAPPAFGGTATFMSPTKSAFGAFGTTVNQPQSPPFGTAGAPQQQNTLFEQLGSSDNAISFGNLAQTANNNQNKPAFGGSAFTSWR